jgi:hypothetical protein
MARRGRSRRIRFVAEIGESQRAAGAQQMVSSQIQKMTCRKLRPSETAGTNS